MLAVLARASLEGAIVAALVWAVIRWLPRLSPATRAALWWCVAAKFLVALVWVTPVELRVLPARAEAPGAVLRLAMPATGSIESGTHVATTGAVDAPVDGTSVNWPAVLLVLWGAGLVSVAVVDLRRLARTRRVIRRSSRRRSRLPRWRPRSPPPLDFAARLLCTCPARRQRRWSSAYCGRAFFCPGTAPRRSPRTKSGWRSATSCRTSSVPISGWVWCRRRPSVSSFFIRSCGWRRASICSAGKRLVTRPFSTRSRRPRRIMAGCFWRSACRTAAPVSASPAPPRLFRCSNGGLPCFAIRRRQLSGGGCSRVS